MGAAVHHTLIEREPALAPGAALLLARAPVFTPLPGVTFLCLVPDNVAAVRAPQPGGKGRNAASGGSGV